MKYFIPRNVKVGQTFMQLELKGWLYFIPTLLVLLGISFLIPKIEVRVISIIFNVFLSHYMFQMDERTGVMNIVLYLEYLVWSYRTEKLVEPVWSDEFDRSSTLQIWKKEQREGNTERKDTD